MIKLIKILKITLSGVKDILLKAIKDILSGVVYIPGFWEIKLPPGAYELVDINNYIQQEIFN